MRPGKYARANRSRKACRCGDDRATGTVPAAVAVDAVTARSSTGSRRKEKPWEGMCVGNRNAAGRQEKRSCTSTTTCASIGWLAMYAVAAACCAKSSKNCSRLSRSQRDTRPDWRDTATWNADFAMSMPMRVSFLHEGLLPGHAAATLHIDADQVVGGVHLINAAGKISAGSKPRPLQLSHCSAETRRSAKHE